MRVLLSAEGAREIGRRIDPDYGHPRDRRRPVRGMGLSLLVGELWADDIERHEALCERAGVRNLRGPPVAAGGSKLGAV